MQNGKIAVPTNNPGGLEAERSDHFGHCDTYTVVDIVDGVISKTETVKNSGHEEGGCMVPVQKLGEMGVDAILVGGIGTRPLQNFAALGIDVFFAPKTLFPDAGSAVDGLLLNKLPVMAPNQACQGHGNCHSH
jgi:predicted Fe-Mo cluster-binding NifX family protein